MTANLWMKHAGALADAYHRAAGPLRFELVTRALAQHLPAGPQRILDIGGGYGEQAVRLARLGHHVTILDCDPVMLAIAASKRVQEDSGVAARIRLVEGDGAIACPDGPGRYDLACCHSVLMYEADPMPMLRNIAASVGAAGLVSILALNSNARAMRAGLQGRWKEAADSIASGRQVGGHCVPSHEHSIDDIVAFLHASGFHVEQAYGVGVFTDHLSEPVAVDDLEEIVRVEWLAGMTDPYRQVARCIHLVARRSPTRGGKPAEANATAGSGYRRKRRLPARG